MSGSSGDPRILSALLKRGLITEREAAQAVASPGGVQFLLRGLVEGRRLTTSDYARIVGEAPPGTAGPPVEDPGAEYPGVPIGEFGDYDILRELGRGGMGVVYLARHRPSGEERALKVALGGAERSTERFRREAAAASRLDHPGIVRTLDAGEIGGLPFMAMEFVRGTSLEAVMKERRFAVEEAVDLVAQVAEAVDHAHRKGVIHRDLKPQNIMMDDAGTPRVMDFGLARDLDRMTRLTKTGTSLGTPVYMAPEQVAGRSKEAGPRTDVYALGVILYELLAGRRPFAADNLIQLYHRIAHDEPDPIRSANPEVPETLDLAVLTALAKEPSQRYDSAGGFARDIRRAVAGESVQARRPSLARRLVRRVGAPGVLAIALGTAAVAALGGVLIVGRMGGATRPDDPPRAEAPRPPEGPAPIAPAELPAEEPAPPAEDAPPPESPVGWQPPVGPDAAEESAASLQALLEEAWRIEASGDHHAAAEALDRYLARGGVLTGIDALFRGGVVYRNAGRAEEAYRRLLAASRLDRPPRVWQIWFNLAGCCTDADEAIRHYTTGVEAAERAGQNPFWCYVRRGDRRFGSSLADARADYEAAIRLNAGADEPWGSYGYILWQMGDPETAVRHLSTAIQRYAPTNPSRTRDILRRGFVYLDLARPTEARRDFEAVLALTPGEPLGRGGLGACRLLEGDAAGALAAIREAAAAVPDHPYLRPWLERAEAAAPR